MSYLKTCHMLRYFGVASTDELFFINNIAPPGPVSLTDDDWIDFQIHFGGMVARRLLKEHFTAIGRSNDDGVFWSCVHVATRIIKCGADMRLLKTAPYVELAGRPKYNPDFQQADWNMIGYAGSVSDLILIVTVDD